MNAFFAYKTMNLRALRYFVCIADCGSFSTASAQLHRSQSALSRAVQELESELGVQLFAREGRRISLSAEGASIREHARVLLLHAQGLLGQAHKLRSGQAGLLRVGTAAGAIEWVLTPLLRSFARNFPDVELRLSTQSGGALIAAVEQGELDIAITRCTTSELLDARLLFPMHIVALVPASHALADKAVLSVTDLQEQKLLLGPAASTSRILFDMACKAVEMRPAIALETPDLHAMKALADAGFGVAIAPSMVSLAGSQLKALPIRFDGQMLGIWTGAVWNRRQPSAFAAAFVDTAVRQFKRDYPGKALRLPALAKLPP
jgi:LysR family transcriptional activator of glutamate synthase operon